MISVFRTKRSESSRQFALLGGSVLDDCRAKEDEGAPTSQRTVRYDVSTV